MGVPGLWQLLDPTGKPVRLETLEGKVLAIDVSIWIHQVLHGYQDHSGGSMPNSHLLGLFNRICKLLFYKIKPVFVFDGGVPLLKKNTIAARKKQKSIATNQARRLKNELINNLIKHNAIKGQLDKKNDEASSSQLPVTSPSKSMYDLSGIPFASQIEEEDLYDYPEEDIELSPRKQAKWADNIHNVNVNTEEFRNLPADVRYDILTDLKETRKQNSWGQIQEMPGKSRDFSDFQMKRLLKRRFVQESLEVAEKEMGGKTLTLGELDKLLTEQGILTTCQDYAQRIASDSKTRLLYVNENKRPSNETDKKLVNNRLDLDDSSATDCTMMSDFNVSVSNEMLDYDFDSDSNCTYVSEVNETQISSKDMSITGVNPAMAYMLEYSGLTQEQIAQMIKECRKKKKSGSSSSKASSKKGRLAKRNLFTQKLNDVSKDCGETSKIEEKIAESDNFIVSEENVVKDEVKTISEAVFISSDSDSDFVEVEDDPAPHILNTKKSIACEITIKPDASSDDMFDDIFKIDVIKSNTSLEEINNPVTNLPTQDKSESISVQLIPEKLEEKSKEPVNPIVITDSPIKNEVNLSVCETAKDLIENILPEENKSNDTKNTEIVKEIVIPTPEELLKMKERLETEQKEISGTIKKLERQAIDVTDQMQLEAQELLRLFGIPYLVAPMEAEAQCAFLEHIKLTEGTITDDSDIWLFGGNCVYKNFFNNNKHVYQFLSTDIHHHLKLTRKQMIQLALLVGSDYTEGLTGVGPVTALEILAAFPSESDDLLRGLTKFCAWLKNNKFTPSSSLRTKLKDVTIDKGFPSQAVVQAYLYPVVNESKETFAWGKPNLVLLADYVRHKFGWTKFKFDEILNPVMKRFNETKSQKRLESYFKVDTTQTSIEGSMSKRVQSAIRKLGGNIDNSAEGESSIVKPKQRKKKSKVEEEVNNLPVISEVDEKPESDIIMKKVHKEEVIPQREKDKANALKSKIRAVEIFQKTKKRLNRGKKVKKVVKPIKEDAELSESSSSS